MRKATPLAHLLVPEGRQLPPLLLGALPQTDLCSRKHPVAVMPIQLWICLFVALATLHISVLCVQWNNTFPRGSLFPLLLLKLFLALEACAGELGGPHAECMEKPREDWVAPEDKVLRRWARSGGRLFLPASVMNEEGRGMNRSLEPATHPIVPHTSSFQPRTWFQDARVEPPPLSLSPAACAQIPDKCNAVRDTSEPCQYPTFLWEEALGSARSKLLGSPPLPAPQQDHPGFQRTLAQEF